jgi:hypothetical protein
MEYNYSIEGDVMKKSMLFAVVISLASFAAYAQPIKISAGAGIAWVPGIFENQTITDSAGILFPAGTEVKTDMSYAAFGIRGFLDFTYGLVSIGYRGAVSKMNTKVSVMGISVSADSDFSISQLELRLLGKYPFSFGTFSVFPLVGIESSICLAGKSGTVDFNDKAKSGFSDFSLLFGVGSDIKLSEQLYFRPDFIIGVNLTSKREDAYYTGVTYKSSSGMLVQIGLGIGYNFD